MIQKDYNPVISRQLIKVSKEMLKQGCCATSRERHVSSLKRNLHNCEARGLEMQLLCDEREHSGVFPKFLNGAELALNSVISENSGNVIYH